MERLRLHTLLCAFLFISPFLAISTPVSAELSGNIAFSTDGLSMSPSTAVEGGDVTFTLSLQNVANIIAEDVKVEFHKNTLVAGNPAAAHSVDVASNSFEDVTFVWTNLAWGGGEQTLAIKVDHGDDPRIIYHDFNVDGLPNLRLSHFELSPATGMFEGDVIDIEIQVENAGNADAPSSHLELTVAGTPLSLLSVPSLLAGGAVWINETINAPVAGTHNAIAVVNADSGDNIVESTTADNSESRSFTVDTLPDYRHADGPTVVADLGLAGPWTVSGTIARDGGTGTTTAPLELRIQNGIVIEILTLTFTESDPFAEYSTVITSEDLMNPDSGDIHIDLEIDSTANLAQSNPFNNLQSVVLTIYPEPNVIVTSVSKPDDTEPGTLVEFTVTLQNVGMIPVSGQLSATFDGEPLTPKSLTIPPINGGNQGYRTQIFSVTAEGLSRDIPFVATWTKDEGSYDLLTSDNVGTNYVTLNSELSLDFLKNTEGWSMGPPLYAGNTYVYSIDVFAQVGVGQETFRCSDQKTGITFDENIVLQFDQDSNKQQTIRCSVKVVTPGEIVLLIEAEGTSISQAHMNDWFIEPAIGGGDGSGSAGSSSIILFTVAGLLALAVLVGAIVLTRRGLADADRETYDLCPACDGDIEGDEDICPHCDFDLRVGRAKFHDCLDCNSTIPSMLEHCPYCGTEQDMGAQYERRERKFKPLPEEVEDEIEVEYEDEDEIVRGHEGFDTHAGDLGFDEEQWEGEWDENLTEAETYFDTKEEERIAAEEGASEDAEAADLVTSTELSEVMDEMPEHDLDAFLGDVKTRRHITDADVELTASDADYREQIFELTGEDGVLPGQQVNVDSMIDNTVVGNEVRSASSDFTIGDDEPVAKVEPESDDTDEKPTSKRRGVRRRKKEE